MHASDQLDRSALVNELIRTVVGDGTARDSARFVALVGPWGSGKTWLLEEMKPRLGGHTRYFNPWLFSDELGLFRGFAAFLMERIKDTNVRERVAGALDVIGPSLKGFGFDLSGSAKKAADAIHGFGSPEEIRSQLKSAFDDGVGAAYVLVDDLDRLTPPELLLFFKLVRLVGDVPGLVYVLVYDEDALLHILARTDIAGGSKERARQYLEKVVESKLSVPRMSRTQWVDRLLNPLIEHGLETHPMFTRTTAAYREFEWRIESLAWRKIATPRLIERLLDAVRGLPESLRGEVNYLDWCLISLIRIAYPGVWQTVVDHPDVFAGMNVGVLLRSLTDGEKSRAKQVAEAISAEAETPYDLDDLLDLLDYLFPRFAKNRADGNGYPSGSATEEQQSIGDPAFFDRYFAHALPPGEVADMTVRSYLTQLDRPDGNPNATAALTRLFEENPGETLRTLRRRWREAASPGATFAFLRTIATSPGLERVSEGQFGLPGKSILRMLASDVLSMESEPGLEKFQVTESDSLDPLVVELALAQGPTYGSQHYVEWLARQRGVLEDLAYEELIASNCLEDDFTVSEALLQLRRLNPDRARDVSLTAVVDGRWLPEDLVGSAVAFSYTGPNDQPTLRNLRISRVIVAYDDLVGAVRGHESAPYPEDWDDNPDRVVGRSAPVRHLGAYALAHWEAATLAD